MSVRRQKPEDPEETKRIEKEKKETEIRAKVEDKAATKRIEKEKKQSKS